MDEKFIESIDRLMTDTGLSQRQIALKAGIDPSQITRWKRGENVPSTRMLVRIKKAFPDFNYPGSSFREIYQSDDNNVRKVPYYDVDVSVGDLAFYADNLEHPTYHIMLPAFEDCEFVVPVYGHSMKPIINNGDQIACKEISERQFFNYGEVYLVVTDEQRMVKRLKRSAREGNVLLSSHNPDYDDIEIPIDKILKLYIVKGIIKRNQL